MVYVVVGSAKIDEGFAALIRKFYPHPEFHDFKNLHDIGLVQTRAKIPENQYTKRIYLATDIVIGAKSVISGFGITSPAAKDSPTDLRFLSTKVIDNDSCLRLLPPSKIHNNTFCTLSPPGYGACPGCMTFLIMFK